MAINHGDLQNFGQVMAFQSVVIAPVDSEIIQQSQIALILNGEVLVDNHTGFPLNSIEQIRAGINLLVAIMVQLDIQITSCNYIVATGNAVSKPCEGSTHQHAHTQQQGKDAGEQCVAGNVFAFHYSISS